MGSGDDPGTTRGATLHWKDIDTMGELLTPTHLILVLVVALLVFGPRKLPELGKGLGEGLKGFKDGIKGGPDVTKQQETSVVPPKNEPIEPIHPS